MLRAIPVDREVISVRRVRNSRSARFLRREIHHARIQRQQQVEAAPVQRQILHLLLAYHARNVRCRHAHDRRVLHNLHLRGYRTNSQGEVDLGIFADHQTHARSQDFRKTGFIGAHFVGANRQREYPIAAVTVGARRTHQPGVHVARGHRGSRHHTAGGIQQLPCQIRGILRRGASRAHQQQRYQRDPTHAAAGQRQCFEHSVYGAPHTRRRHFGHSCRHNHTHHEFSSRNLLPPTATRVLRPTKIYEFIRKIQIGWCDSMRTRRPAAERRPNVARHGGRRRRPECREKRNNRAKSRRDGRASCFISARQCSQASVARPLRFQHGRGHPPIHASAPVVDFRWPISST